MSKWLTIGIAIIGLGAGAGIAEAQVDRPQGPSTPSTPQPPQGPTLPAPNRTVPEQILPNAPGGYKPQDNQSGNDKSLTRKLGETGGVLKPPATITPKMTVIPPSPNMDSGAVIAPSELPRNAQHGQNPTPNAD